MEKQSQECCPKFDIENGTEKHLTGKTNFSLKKLFLLFFISFSSHDWEKGYENALFSREI